MTVSEVDTGPVVTQFELNLEKGLRVSKVAALADDLAIALRVPAVRVVSPIPGKNTVGVEVPNEKQVMVRLRELIEVVAGRRGEAPHPDVPRQGRHRPAAGRRPGEDAAPAHRRPHRHGQERVPQHADHVDPDDPLAGRGPDADDRPEDGRAQPVQAHSAPDAPRHHRHEEGRGRARLGRRQDGGALRPARPLRRAAPRQLQQALARGAARADGARANSKRRRSRFPSACRTS